ncbi:MAG: pyruvate dehydrogenase (acetyl-transferring) E1 component subunit alpha [Spirulinaceae cyanobacterium RM2_2_10]|nr:pyruvate dehydrogenase (acetyl-transferring) E1 component subunit alpha [Spirulinaceae cyanobacterium SM2_1_0]NJO18888.1 pyruvate dehydrogenase (acetyl-transferring) E1 component subunit alpha [Spirulinaceae cyanobacterium RM2_2_10]
MVSEGVKTDVTDWPQAERSLPPRPDPLVTITKEEGLVIYEDMVLGRFFEDKCAEMYYRGKMFGFVHLYNGQEAVSTGIVKALNPNKDFVSSTYRDHVHALSAGVPAREVMAELFGKETGCSKGRGGSMHMFSAAHRLLGGYAFVAEGIPVATGAAFQSKYRREAMGDPDADAVTVCFFGDGASNNGQFFECLNMAALWKLPIIYVVENNKWAIGMAHDRATSQPEIYKKASVFDMVGVEVDGMDVMAVHTLAQEAVARARAGEGPTLVEALTYRFRGHSLADPDELRAPDEKQAWFARDPIERFAAELTEQNLASHDELKAIDDKVAAVIEDAVEFAESSPDPDPSELYRYIFAED